MDLSKTKRQLNKMSTAEITLIQKYCDKRMPIARRKESKERDTAAWEWVKTLHPGDEIWCARIDKPIDSRIHYGDKLIVHEIQPRKKELWVVGQAQIACFKPDAVARYKLQSRPPQ